VDCQAENQIIVKIMKILGAPVGEPTMGKFQKTNAKFQINFKFQ